jgi:PEP-CTERM motif-containing protein
MHMKKLFLPAAAVAFALLAPLGTARADSHTYDFCSTSVSLNFCGSVTVTATAAESGGTDISFTVVNTTATTPTAVFTAIGINNSALSNTATYSGLTVKQGAATFTGWEVGMGFVTGDDGTVAVSALSSTLQNGLENSISPACSGSNPRIYTCGIGGPANPVTISFHTTDSGVSVDDGSTDLYVNAAAERGACVAGCETTTTPEPATLALFATGLLGMGGPISRFRRRRNG